MTDDRTPPEPSGTLDAADYVLGLLEPRAQAAAEARMTTDTAFARDVEMWRQRMSEFDDTAETPATGDTLWEMIDMRVATQPAAATPRARGAWFADALRPIWDSVPGLRLAALTASTAALALAVTSVLLVRHARDVEARKPLLVAILVDEGTNRAGAVVNAFAGGRVEMIPLTDIAVPPGRALQIWTLWDRQVGPRSVGLIDRARTTSLDLHDMPVTGPDQLFEITVEPATGSPTGRPTGPVLFKGNTASTL